MKTIRILFMWVSAPLGLLLNNMRVWILLIVCVILNPVVVISQPGFDFIVWNQSGGLIHSGTPDQTISRLEEHWHHQLMPSMLSVQLQIHKPISMEFYLKMIERLQPVCIEGDPAYVELAVNAQRQMKYIPILQTKHTLAGELIFRSPAPNWQGELGVVHPDYNPGGRLQMQLWKAQTGTNPQPHVFNSPQEALMHLMVGSVQAATVPEGALDDFLEEQHRLDLLDYFHRIETPNPLPATMIFIRQDWYTNTVKRTLITETWLRDALPQKLSLVPKAVSFLRDSE